MSRRSELNVKRALPGMYVLMRTLIIFFLVIVGFLIILSPTHASAQYGGYGHAAVAPSPVGFDESGNLLYPRSYNGGGYGGYGYGRPRVSLVVTNPNFTIIVPLNQPSRRSRRHW